MSSTLAKPNPFPNPSSRSSTSSSVVTVQRVISPTPRNGNRTPVTSLRPKSPTTTTQKRSQSPISKIKKSAGNSRSNSTSGIADGLGNLNRWSQSTSSSKSSASIQHNSIGSARRLSGSAPPTSPQASSAAKRLPNKSITSSLSNSPPGSTLLPSRPPPGGTSSTANATSLFEVLDVPQAISAIDQMSPTTPTTPTTPTILASATYMPGAEDYFSESWGSVSPPRNRVIEARLAPISSAHQSSSAQAQIISGSKNSFARPSSTATGSPRARHGQSNSRATDSHNLSQNSDSRRGELPGSEIGRVEGDAGHVSGPGERSRRRKAPSQKAMLSRALQKANHAVVLDHAQNFEGAMDAYGDACDLLQHVMIRSSGEEHRKQLQAIRDTYKSRITEILNNELHQDVVNDKALPEVPPNMDSKGPEQFSPIIDEDDFDDTLSQTTTELRMGRGNKAMRDLRSSVTFTREQLPPRRQSLMPFLPTETEPRVTHAVLKTQMDLSLLNSKDDLDGSVVEGASLRLAPPMYKINEPPPLSPRRPRSPARVKGKSVASQQDIQADVIGPATLLNGSPAASQSQPLHKFHLTTGAAESTSWFDLNGDSGGSSASSVHSRSSIAGTPSQHTREGSGNTEAEFDAALDAAVEAAYDERLESSEGASGQTLPQPVASQIKGGSISEIKRRVELAKQKAFEVQRETTVIAAKDRENPRLLGQPIGRNRHESIDLIYGDDEAEEEERILEEMTRDYIMDDTEYDIQTKSALPRQSNSSGFSRRTWNSSVGSNPNTAGTSLSTVAEPATTTFPAQVQKQPPLPTLLPPTNAPPPPPSPPSRVSNIVVPIGRAKSPPFKTSSLLPLTTKPAPGVRERRFSGQKAKQLKIDINTKASGGMAVSKPPQLIPVPAVALAHSDVDLPQSSSLPRGSQKEQPVLFSKPSLIPHSSRQLPSSFPAPSPPDEIVGSHNKEANSSSTAMSDENTAIPPQNSPSRTSTKTSMRPGSLRKNFSSSSLRSLKQPLPTPTEVDGSPLTPMSRVFSIASQPRNGSIPSVPSLPTPAAAYFSKGTLPPGTLSFFDSDIHGPHSPGSADGSALDAPIPLEPCPESFLLRPYWLLRCVFNTIAHPRGGYISSRLFVPRDIWRVRNVKLKNVEDKVMNCDLLTAALLKLGKVDTYDADAVLEEMQSFEAVMDQVQSLLSKRLGAEVGVQGSSALFRGLPDETSTSNDGVTSKSTNTNNKSYLSTWRKLRSKNSMGPGAPPATSSAQSKESVRDTPNLRSLPMTTLMNPRFSKRDVGKLTGMGPNSHYMTSLARLSDAVQVLDQIARQVEDPGLKHSSQTHVGLELSSRHASEFFAFYICRFILTDMGMMLDKFVKRGSEWVLA